MSLRPEIHATPETITIVVKDATTDQRRYEKLGEPNENGHYDTRAVDTTWQGDLTITIDVRGIVVDFHKALSHKTHHAIGMGGNIDAKATNVRAASVRSDQ